MLESFSASHCHTFTVPVSPRTSSEISQSILFSPLPQILTAPEADERRGAGNFGGAVASVLVPGNIAMMDNRQSATLPLERETVTLEAPGTSAGVRLAPLMNVEFPKGTLSDETAADYWLKYAPWVMETPTDMEAIGESAELDDGDASSDAGSFHSAETG